MAFAGEEIINFLLIGETGVGKSTFINSFANYISNTTFDEAIRKKPILPIPTIFTVYDEELMEDVTVTVGKKKGEKQEIGASCTQGLDTYLFPLEGQDKIIQLIDTPGVGDTDGLVRDDKNWDEILIFLAQLKYVHGVCLLLKPTNDRNTALFSYVIRRILSQLHKSAVDNIVFIFTNTKGSNYRPGATFPILKKMRDEIKQDPPFVEIPITNDNVFCLDNESLKYLLAIHQGIKIGEDCIEGCKLSWNKSCREIQRLIDYVSTIHPHNVKDTVSVNKTRDLILQLAKPMAETLQMVEDNIKQLQAKEKDSEQSGQSIEQLKQKLYKPGRDIEIVQMDKPAVVCTNCVDTIDVNGTTRTKYTNRCHDPCLTGLVAYEIKGHWSLASCEVMNWSFNCTKCGCSFKKHMTIFYDTKVVQKQFVDKDVDFELKSEQKQWERLKEIIAGMKAQKKELEGELQFLRECAAKFACYLENNAITSSYDAFKEYIMLALESERRRGNKANPEIIKTLTYALNEHEKLIESFKTHKINDPGTTITELTIQEDIEKLKKLKNVGVKIVQILNARASCYKASSHFTFKNAFTHVIPKCFFGKK